MTVSCRRSALDDTEPPDVVERVTLYGGMDRRRAWSGRVPGGRGIAGYDAHDAHAF